MQQSSISPSLSSYHFTIQQIFKESWQYTKGVKWPFYRFMLLAALIAAVIIIPLRMGSAALVRPLLESPDFQANPHKILTAFSIFFLYIFIQSFLIICITIIVNTITTRQALGLTPKAKTALSQVFDSKYRVFLISAILALFGIGWIFTIAFCIFLPIAPIVKIIVIIFLLLLDLYVSITFYYFIISLIIFKKSSVWQATKTGFLITTKNFFKMLACYILMILLMIISAIPLGIGLIWTMPMAYVMNGVFFKKFFGETLSFNSVE